MTSCLNCGTTIVKSFSGVTCPVCGSEKLDRFPEDLTRNRSVAIEEVNTDIFLKMIRRWNIDNIHASFLGYH